MPTENELRYFKVSFATLAAISATRKNIKAEDMHNMNFQRLFFVCLLFKVIGSESRSVVSDSLRPHGLYSPWNSPDQNTGVTSLSLLQGLFPSQGLNPGDPHFRRILYHLSHKGNPRRPGWVAYPFSREIFLTQELNQGRLHCRRILNQLSYQGSPSLYVNIYIKQNRLSSIFSLPKHFS